MQRVHFCSGTTFLTGDRIATSLLHYVAAVASTGRSDVVSVPVVSSSGSGATVTLMVNRVSQISAESVASDAGELHDGAFADRLDALAADLLSTTPWLGWDHALDERTS